MGVLIDVLLFFKQKTAYEVRISDWSSDVCSSDLASPRSHRCRLRVGNPASGACPGRIRATWCLLRAVVAAASGQWAQADCRDGFRASLEVVITQTLKAKGAKQSAARKAGCDVGRRPAGDTARITHPAPVKYDCPASTHGAVADYDRSVAQ